MVALVLWQTLHSIYLCGASDLYLYLETLCNTL